MSDGAVVFSDRVGKYYFLVIQFLNFRSREIPELLDASVSELIEGAELIALELLSMDDEI